MSGGSGRTTTEHGIICEAAPLESDNWHSWHKFYMSDRQETSQRAASPSITPPLRLAPPMP